jgi:hypothetical protein
MATKKAPKKSLPKPAAAAKTAAGKKKPPGKGGGKQAQVSPRTIDDFVVLFACNADVDITKAEKLLAKFKAGLLDAKIVGFFRTPGLH